MPTDRIIEKPLYLELLYACKAKIQVCCNEYLSEWDLEKTEERNAPQTGSIVCESRTLVLFIYTHCVVLWHYCTKLNSSEN